MVDVIWIAALIVFAIWWYVVADLDKAGILKKYNITAWGPVLMLRTYRGQKLLDWIAKPKGLWRAILILGMPIVIAAMVFMLVTFIGIDLWFLFRIEDIPPPGPANLPQNIIAIPGINQFIPFWWGWVALIIAMVAHEFAHAILSKVENVKVNSLGLIVMPLPLGAFAEIDEEQLFGTKSEGKTADIIGPMETKASGEGKRRASPRQFVNILSAGVVANFLVALIAFALLFGPVLGAIAASSDQVIVYNVAPGSPADAAGIKPNMIISSVDGQPVMSSTQIDDYLRAHPDQNVTISGFLSGKPVDYSVHVNDGKGVYILGTINDNTSPAFVAGIKPNMRLVAIDGTPIADTAAFNDYMNTTKPGQTATLSLIDGNGTAMNATLVLASGTLPKGYIGVTTNDLSNNMAGISYGTAFPGGFLSGLKNMPFSIQGWMRIFILPVLQFMGSDPGFGVFTGEFASLYHPVGWAAPFGTLVYSLAECLYWIGWLNLNVGLFNCLPMIPMDGGHIFREATRTFLGGLIKDREKAERITKTIVNAFAVTLLASIIFMFLAPYFAQWFLR